MNGIELSEKFYLEYGKKIICEELREWEDWIAVGIAGRGSECFGYDDETSRDHDYEPGFTIWIPQSLNQQAFSAISRAYSSLPREFMGVRMQSGSRLGGTHFGVQTIEEFFSSLIGSACPPNSWEQSFYTPEHALASAVNGKIFRDNLGEMTAFRDMLLFGMPEDVRRKKISARLALMAQSGQYNYSRCLAHGEPAAAGLALSEFVTHSLFAIFAINRHYTPFYKWRFRALRELPLWAELEKSLAYLLMHGSNESDNSSKTEEQVELICSKILLAVQQEGLSTLSDSFLEPHAFAVAETITNPKIRALHIMDCGE